MTGIGRNSRRLAQELAKRKNTSQRFHSGPGLAQASAQAAVAVPQHVDEVEDTGSALARMNEELRPIQHNPLRVLEWAMQEFDGRLAMSTSFGIQSSVLLHLATTINPKIPVVWVDTGYLPEETYRYAADLTEALDLNLTIASNQEWSPARMEAIHGKLWEADDAESHGLYGRLRKVQPMQAALDALEPNPLVLLSGLRAAQTKARANMPPIGFQQGRFKILPMLKMTDDDVDNYMDVHDLPHHPLRAKGYVTVGDWHSSRPVQEGEDPRNTRFGGKFQECGLHVDSHEPVAEESGATAQTTTIETPQTLSPESLEKTGIKALGLTKAHDDTEVAVIMVKKLTEDGSYCRKCNDVADKIETDNLTDWIGYTAVADVKDSSSEGAVLAKHFGVVTAPFFLVRDKETEEKRGEWKVVRSYLQLRKQLEKAADRIIAKSEHTPQELAETDPEFQKTSKSLEQLKLEIEKLQLELHDKLEVAQKTENDLNERKHALGLQ